MMNLINIYTRPLTLFGNLILKNKNSKIITSVIFAILLLGCLGILFYANIIVKDEKIKKFILDSVLPFLIIPIITIILSIASSLSEKISDKVEIELEKLREERDEITQKIEENNEFDIFHTIQLSLNQLNEYYTINKDQARSSFRFSIFSIVIGLLTILAGVWLYYLGQTNVQLGYITGISGIILEFIGGAYFFMYKKSLEQVNFFFGQLIKIQDTMLSINLADNINNDNKKTEMHEKIIVSLLERSLK